MRTVNVYRAFLKNKSFPCKKITHTHTNPPTVYTYIHETLDPLTGGGLARAHRSYEKKKKHNKLSINIICMYTQERLSII